MNDVKILQLSYGNYVSANDYFKLQSNWNSLREWLEEEKTRLARECSNIYEDSLGRTKLVNEVVFNELDNVLDKMNELEKRIDNEKVRNN